MSKFGYFGQGEFEPVEPGSDQVIGVIAFTRPGGTVQERRRLPERVFEAGQEREAERYAEEQFVKLIDKGLL
jgi:hypothetical protein